MKRELKTKFNIGDKVKKYDEYWIHDKKVVCPICKGNYKAFNPNYDYCEDEILTCGCCDNGYIYVNERKEKRLSDTIYEIERISADITTEGISYKYSIASKPELNGSTHGYSFCTASEDDLVLAEER